MRVWRCAAVAGVCGMSALELLQRTNVQCRAATATPPEPPASHHTSAMSKPTDPRVASSFVAAAAPAEPPSLAPSLLRRCLAEAIGTGIIVHLGCGAVCAAKFAGSNVSPFGVAATWGVAVALAIYTAGPISGAHLNPAVTAGLVSVGKAPAEEAPFYMLAQLAGATVASAATYGLFSRAIVATELAGGVVRGSAASAATFAGAFGLVPNTALVATVAGVIAVEAAATGALTFLISAITDPEGHVPAAAAPVLIGATVTALICVVGPLTGACMNPARDLGPRIVAALAGWRGATVPFTLAYALGPTLGALAGFGLHGVCMERPRPSREMPRT